MVKRRNLGLLKIYYPLIYQKIKEYKINNGEYQILKTRTSYPTIKTKINQRELFLHSKYDPIKEAVGFAGENSKTDTDNYLLYGFGLGYHIKELLALNKESNFYIFESNFDIFKIATENIDLQDILQNKRVKLFVDDDINSFSDNFNKALKLERIKLIIHLPSIQIIKDSLAEIKYLLEDFHVDQLSLTKNSLLEANFEYNILHYNKNVDVLFNRFNNIPLILVSAGPSLDKNKHLLTDIKGRALILAVGTAVKPLLNIGIIPDLIIITDPQEIVYNQLEGLDIDIPIIILSTCNKKVMNYYKGYKFFALQQGFEKAELYAKKNKNKLVKTGGSVATTALDIAIKFGSNPVIFIGQDLAYTNNQTHAAGTYFYNEVNDKRYLRPVKGYDGSIVYTSKNLYKYLNWIEKRIKEEKDIRFINATEGGAYIEGTKHIPLSQVEFLTKNNYSFASIIEEVKESNGSLRSRSLSEKH